MKKNKQNLRGGQAMILSIILLGGMLLAASAVAGLLTIFQIRQSNNAVRSTQAIFAADAGLEWATYLCYGQGVCDPDFEGDLDKNLFEAEPIFSNPSASVEVYQYARDAKGKVKFSAEGTFGNSIRLLDVTFGIEP